MTGSFTSYSVTLGTGGPRLFNSSSLSEGYVAKLNGTTRQWQWARRFGGTRDDEGLSLVATPRGAVYVLATSASQNADFGSFVLADTVSVLLGPCWAKLDPSGSWEWARQMSPEGGLLQAHCLTLGTGGILYAAGEFWAPAVRLGNTRLTTSRMPATPTPFGGDLFLAAADSVGTWQWAEQGDAAAGQNIAELRGLSYDGRDRLYVGGSYSNTAVRIGSFVLPNSSQRTPQPNPLPPIPYTNNYYSDAYVACFELSTRSWRWATRAGGPLGDGIGTVVAGPRGRVYTLGNFASPLNPNVFLNIAWLDAGTGTWQGGWNSAPVVVRQIATDAGGHLKVVGSFYNTNAAFGGITLAGAGPGSDTGFAARLGAGILPTRTSIMPSKPDAMRIWPNPTAGRTVQVQGPAPKQLVEVLDVLGRQITSGRMPGIGPLQLVLPATLPSGVYVVRGGGQARRLVVE